MFRFLIQRPPLNNEDASLRRGQICSEVLSEVLSTLLLELTLCPLHYNLRSNDRFIVAVCSMYVKICESGFLRIKYLWDSFPDFFPLFSFIWSLSFLWFYTKSKGNWIRTYFVSDIIIMAFLIDKEDHTIISVLNFLVFVASFLFLAYVVSGLNSFKTAFKRCFWQYSTDILIIKVCFWKSLLWKKTLIFHFCSKRLESSDFGGPSKRPSFLSGLWLKNSGSNNEFPVIVSMCPEAMETFGHT